jgi:phenylacetate-CoA ligase
LHERLKGKRTHARLEELERTQWYSPEELKVLQLQRLRPLLEYAYREVPYYTQLFNEHDLQPWRITSLKDFARIPHLTKQIIRERFDDLRPRTRLRRATRITTGGSTGAPMTLLVDAERNAFADAVRLRAHRWFGVDIGSREVALWGSPIEVTKQDALRVLRDRMLNYRLLSAFDLGEPALSRYAQILRRERPEKVFGYASALYLLARYLRRIGWSTDGSYPRVVFTTAEPLYDYQRETIQSVFGCPVSIEYGCREAGVIATECPAGGIHIASEGIILEIIGSDAGMIGTGGEVVITVLDSWAMPIIRHRTGDIGTLQVEECECGRGLPCLNNIEGRRTDFLVTPGGKVMHALAVNYIMREFATIREFQVIQESLDRLIVTVVPEESFTDSVREAVLRRLRALFDGETAVEVTLSPSIPRLASGKHRYVISEVGKQYLDSRMG